jgi:hypothetical protein
MDNFFEVSEVPKKEIIELKEIPKKELNLKEFLEHPRLTFKEKKFRRYPIKVFIFNQIITFEYKDNKISGSLSELKKIFNFCKDYNFSFGDTKFGFHSLYNGDNKGGLNLANFNKNENVKELLLNIDDVILSFEELKSIIKESNKNIIIKWGNKTSFIDYRNLNLETYTHFLVKHEDVLVSDKLKLEDIKVISK